jgi:hypothetical protein
VREMMSRLLLMTILLVLPILIGQPDNRAGTLDHENYVLELLSFEFTFFDNDVDYHDKSVFFNTIPYLVLIIFSLIKVTFIQEHVHKMRNFLQAVFYQANYVVETPLNKPSHS